jgi:hypothetical protein
MKTTRSSSVKAFAKSAFILGMTALLFVGCGKSDKKADALGPAISPFTFGNGTGTASCASPVQRAFDYNNGQLTPAGINASAVYASYIGIDVQTGDTAMIRDHGNNVLQLILTLCLTGDASIDNMLQGGTPTITSTLSVDLNVPNKAQCPGRINAGDVFFGKVPSYQYGQIPVGSRFQPPSQCL